MLTIWHDAHAIWPGLSQFDLPADPATRDRYIMDTIMRLHLSMEREHDGEEEPTPRLSAARRLVWEMLSEWNQQKALLVAMAAE